MGDNIFACQEITKSYGGLLAVDHFDISLRRGEIVSLVGPNGAGKTTIFDCVTGFTPIDSGKVIFCDHDITGLKTHEIARKGMGRTFQLVRVFNSMVVLENVVQAQDRFTSEGHWQKICSLFYDFSRKKKVQRALELLELAKLGKKKNIPAGDLPVGERKRLELAMALATQPILLLLDEPTSGMNPRETNEVVEILYHLKRSGMGIWIVEHHMDLVMKVSDRVVVLNFGQKIAEGPPQEVGRDPTVIEAYLGQKRNRYGGRTKRCSK